MFSELPFCSAKVPPCFATATSETRLGHLYALFSLLPNSSARINLQSDQLNKSAQISLAWLAAAVQGGPTEASRATCTFAVEEEEEEEEGEADGSLAEEQEGEQQEQPMGRVDGTGWCSRLKTAGLLVRVTHLHGHSPQVSDE